MEIALAAVVVLVLVAVQVRRRTSPLQRPGEPRETHRRPGAEPDDSTTQGGGVAT